jgi:hypothetical protein
MKAFRKKVLRKKIIRIEIYRIRNNDSLKKAAKNACIHKNALI